MSPARLWKFLCSLKLAIVLASAAVLLLLAGSLLIPGRPDLFGPMDQLPLGEWLSRVAVRQPGLTWWVGAAGLLLALLGVNTACCFIDWVLHLRSRWRKSGEYLLHLGFVLALAGYLWGSMEGYRGAPLSLGVGETAPIPALQGHYLRLEEAAPVLDAMGRVTELEGTMVLLRGDEEIDRHRVRTNSPLLHGGLAVVPLSFGQSPAGLRTALADGRIVDLVPGVRVDLPSGAVLRVLDFFPWAARLPSGAVVHRGDQPVHPALQLELTRPGEEPSQGWYFPAEGVPVFLSRSGIVLRPLEIAYRPRGVFAANHDPGAPLALAGGVAMTAGVLLSFFSFYAKRRRGERPQIV